MSLLKKPDSHRNSLLKTRTDRESVDLFIDDEFPEPGQLQFKSTKISQVEMKLDGASTSSSANGSSSFCEEKYSFKSNPNYLKATRSSEKKKMNSQVTDFINSESTSLGYDENKLVLQKKKAKSSPNFKRNTSMRTLRILMSKPKNASCAQVPEGEGVVRPTSSSTLKDSKLHSVEVEPEERDSEKVSALRVCTYTYCSLHGQHNHSSMPTLKRVLSKRRRFPKAQKGIRSSTSELIKDNKPRELVVNKDSKSRKKGENSKVVSSKKVAEGDEDRIMMTIYPKSSGSMSEVEKYDGSGDGKKKRINIWHLLHNQMVSGLAEGLENQESEIYKPRNGNGETGSEKMGIKNKETENGDMESQKLYATKVVREAIENILLPEVPDQSPNDVSVCSDAPCEEEALEKQNSTEDPPQVGNAKNKAPKNWSNLKKLILLKRFVKELEKVQSINPQKPSVLPVQAEQESENMPLRSEGLKKKKSSEEWMLDYALQQAVNELAPMQKRKVELLIKAFEIVVPPSDGEQTPLSFSKLKVIRKEGDHTDGVLRKYSYSTSNESKYSLDDGDKKTSVVDDDEIDVLAEGKLNQEGIQDESSLSKQSQEVDNAISDQNEDDIEELLGAKNNDSSFSDRGLIEQFNKEEEVTVNDGEICLNEPYSERLNIDVMPVTSSLNHDPIIDSETENNSPQQEFRSKFRKPKNISMWNLIHQEMVAGLADEVKPKESGNKNDDEEGAIDVDTRSQCEEIESQEVELRKVFAIKMVREAIEKILLPEVQDQTSDDQSTTSETIYEQELTEKKQEEDWGAQIFNSFGSTKEDYTQCSTNKVIYDMSLTQKDAVSACTQRQRSETERKELKPEKKAEKQAPKRWSNLKKWIVLQRFVKALEKVNDFNIRKPQLLPLELDPEGETVRLRNQMMNEKRSSEEWMLDYALRKVVSELEPKQKRKVELLVKAFETVAPPTEETKSPVMITKFKSSDGIKLKDTFATKIDDENNDSQIPKEKSDVISRSLRSPFRAMKLDGLVGNSSGESIVSKGNENEMLGLKSIVKLTNKTQSDKQKRMKMWHLLCQHVVSDIAVKVEDHHIFREDNNDESPPENLTVDQKTVSDNLTLKFNKSDAVKLVREAINEILVPNIQEDSSETESIATDISTDIELLEEKRPRNWDKLKKLILLKRSIKALEKARRTKPQAPRNLPLESGKEEEKVDLKNQLLDERKKAEEWMLDYAVQHILTKLTPARKRRVSMLVEAFEAVVPLPLI